MLDKPSGGRLTKKDVIELYEHLLKNKRIDQNGAAHHRLVRIKEAREKFLKMRKYYRK